jgi:glycosyltransferase involved in cell wall biosynthesis
MALQPGSEQIFSTRIIMTSHPRGVTIVIACHNAAERLVPTLRHLLAQQTSAATPWEILVVDNASSDGTAKVARSVWPSDHPAPLRVISEPRLGVGYARMRGLAEARYEYASFVDDDNWVSPQWIEAVYSIFGQNPEVGVCGSRNEAIFEVEPPRWFQQYEHDFAVGDWGPVARYTTYWEIWGAGQSLRRTAWEQIQKAGFSLNLISRQGNQLGSGEDTEIAAAISMFGWKQWYDPQLHLRHFMPTRRLNWAYLRRLWRGFGRASVVLDWYKLALSGNTAALKERVTRGWARNLFRSTQNLVRSRRALQGMKEGDHDQILAEAMLGRVQFLMSGFLAYCRGMRHFQRLLLAAAERTDRPCHAIQEKYQHQSDLS